ncbi:MAG: GPW/gp25 family protein [Bacteroidia bacterium]|nr:GPW/gp25 family protein [Bacteroidia bacterium]
MADYDFIGRGWAFPPTFDKATGGVKMLTGKDDIQSSIEIILTTGIGERVMRPDFGAGMEKLLFEPLDTTLQAYMKDVIQTAILLFESRVILDDVRLEPVQEEGLVRIFIEYTVAGTNTRTNFVFPYYLEEGSQIPNETP